MMNLLPFRIEKHKARWAVAATVGAVLLGGAVFGDHGVFHLQRLRSEQRDLETLVFDLQQRNDRLRRRIERLRSDDLYIEKLARQRLGLARPDEIVYRVLPTPAHDPAETSGNEEAGTGIP